MYLSVKQRRALLKEKVEALAQTGSDSLKAACQQWLDTFDDIDKSRQSTDLLIDELQKAGGEKSTDILASKDILSKKTFWMGNYKITGRLKDMIIRGGENIYPKEIEEFIYTHPKVKDVQVIGVPDEKYGEEAMACIILKEGEEISEPEMRDFIMGRLARHKVPRYIDFVKSFPMNAAGKILKYKMREEAVEKLGLKKK